MKRVIMLSLALVALASLSWASAHFNLWKGNLGIAFANNFASSTAPPPQTITICKKTTPAGGTGFPFLRANGAGALPSFPLNDGGCNTFNMTGQDHYNTFTENVPAGWTLTNISCSHTTSPIKIIGANANPAFQPGDTTVALDLNETNVTCTFYNRRTTPCCNWSIDLRSGQSGPIDPIWKVNGANSYVTTPVSSWIALNPAKWIQVKNSPNPASVAGPVPVYKYTMRFNVPACPTPAHVELHGTFAADNKATALLDGVAIPGASCPGPVCFNSPQAPVPLNVANITPGWHTLEIDVTNLSYGASGLIVNAQLTTVCP